MQGSSIRPSGHPIFDSTLSIPPFHPNPHLLLLVSQPAVKSTARSANTTPTASLPILTPHSLHPDQRTMTRNERTARAKLRLSAFSDPEPRFGRQGSRCHLTPRELKVPRGLGSLWGVGQPERKYLQSQRAMKHCFLLQVADKWQLAVDTTVWRPPAAGSNSSKAFHSQLYSTQRCCRKLSTRSLLLSLSLSSLHHTSFLLRLNIPGRR